MPKKAKSKVTRMSRKNPNAKTIKAMKDIEEGKALKAENITDIYKDLGI